MSCHGGFICTVVNHEYEEEAERHSLIFPEMFKATPELFACHERLVFFSQWLMVFAVSRYERHARMAAQSTRNTAARKVLNWQSLRCMERYERKMRLLWFLYQLYHKAEAFYANSH
jgi:L-rhamnose mutarotase